MKLVLVVVVGFLALAGCLAQHAEPADLDPLDGLDEQEVEEYFHLEKVTDEAELARREAALSAHEAEIKEVNQEYEAGEVSWFDGVNEFADLPDDEFLSQKTGAVMPEEEFGRGLLEPSADQVEDERSERYFEAVRMDRAAVPASYSSLSKGWVSPVKNQQQCGSCVAFSSMAAIETCFKKATGVFGDYSEQQLVDCGYQKEGANGCNGAPPHAYLTWAAQTKLRLAHESQYPYKNTNPSLSCPARMPVYNQGVRISDSYYTYRGDEDLMKKLVFQHGAVVASVKSNGPFQQYKGGVFAGCPRSDKTDHAITVVGYGRDRGVDYWLIKNSWGPSWGENGFIRLKRGVNMCGIGKSITTVSCTRTGGPTDAPLTTAKPCFDKFSNCAELAATSCYQAKIAEGCPKACGLCPGLKPARSVTCYNKFSNCNQMANACNQQNVRDGCKITCGTC